MKKFDINIYILANILLFSMNANAGLPSDPFLTHECKITKSHGIEHFHYKNTGSSNLLTKNAYPYLPESEQVVIYGKVLDKNCKPIANARIFIWQGDSKTHDFSGRISGSTNVNNLGEYIFVTKLSSKGNIIADLVVYSKGIKPVMTTIKLDDNNSFAAKGLNISSHWLYNDQNVTDANKIYNFDMVLNVDRREIRF